jgi:YhcH/YjgK/YiaL family protein
MIHGQYNKPETFAKLLPHPIWNEALTWIQEYAHALPDGEHAIQGRDIYANIQSAQTMQISDSFYEMHEEYIDIHFCLSGGEGIAYAPTGELREKELNREKDYQLFFPTKNQSLCTLEQDSFAIFFPKELHMPKLRDGENTEVKKVVIKIKATMLGEYE